MSPIQTRITLYNTLVLPHLDYGATVWGAASNTSLDRLQKLQNRGMRIILQCHPRTHIQDMLFELKWLNVNQRLKLQRLVLMYTILNGLTPNYMKDMFVGTSEIHHHDTRRRREGALYTQRTHPKSFTRLGSSEWNSLPLTIRDLPHVRAFKRACTAHLARLDSI